MSSLRDDITRSLLRLSRRESPSQAGSGSPSGSIPGRDLPSGTEFGPYRIIRRLGSGGMGHVYLALDTHLGRPVALKFLPDQLTSDPAALYRFYQEAKTASALNHPNILTIYDFAEIAGKHIIVSEFVDGITLRGALETGRLDLKSGLDVMHQVASAMAAAHSAGIVHRDLKPTNIMIRQDGYAKVIDFGLAKLTQRRKETLARDYTRPGSVLGTIGYMSPEQARGENIDERSDIWSLGVILYEVITRRLPFEGMTDSHVIVSILDHPPQPIENPEQLPPGLVSIVERSLEKDRKRRCQTTLEFLADLETVRQSAAPTRVAGKDLFRKRRRLPPPWSAWAALAVIAVAALFWFWSSDIKSRVLGPAWIELGPPVAVTHRGDVSLSTISPDGKYLAYVSKAQGDSVFHLVDRKTGTEKLLPQTAYDYIGITFAPDSQTIYYVLLNQRRARGRLFDLPIQGFGTEPPSLRLEDLDSPIAFSPDGRQFAFVRGTSEPNQENTAIMLMPEGNLRDLRTLVSVKSTEIKGELAWSPRKDWIAAVAYPEHLHGPTRPRVSLYGMDGRLRTSFTPPELRRLSTPVALDRGSLLLFLGIRDDGTQNHLAQLFVPSGEFKAMPTQNVPIETLSATADSQTLAAVRADRRSTVWVADAGQLNAPVEVASEAADLPSLAWSSETDLIYSAITRGSSDTSGSANTSGHVNLARLRPGGKREPLSKPENCVEAEPSTGRGGHVVAYTSNCAYHGDDFQIWTLDLDSSTKRRLTSGSNYDERPDVSPDGKWVFYTSWTSNMPAIWKVPAEGGMPSRLSFAEARNAVVSPDGTSVVCDMREQTHGAWEVVVISTDDGSILRRFPHLPIDKLVRWSPDGTALDYLGADSSPGIWRQPLGGAAPRQILSSRGDSIRYFSWNPGGTKLAYVSAREQRDVVLFSRIQH